MLEYLLSESVLEPLRRTLEEMIQEFPDTFSKDSVHRQLREIYMTTEEALKEALDVVYQTVRSFQEQDLQAIKRIVAKSEVELQEQQDNLWSPPLEEVKDRMMGLGRFAKDMQHRLRELDKPRHEFYIATSGELKEVVAEIIRRAEDQAKAAVAAGLLADAATDKLDPDSSAKH